MRCPYCGSLDDKVLESRTMVNGESIRRRRECISCGYRFTSYERIDEKPFMVVKTDGRRQPFDRQKLEKGIERALEKRPFSTAMVEQICNDIEDSAIKKARKNGKYRLHSLVSLCLKNYMILTKLHTSDLRLYISTLKI